VDQYVECQEMLVVFILLHSTGINADMISHNDVLVYAHDKECDPPTLGTQITRNSSSPWLRESDSVYEFRLQLEMAAKSSCMHSVVT